MTTFGDFALCPTCKGDGKIFVGPPAEGAPGRPAKKNYDVLHTCPTCWGGHKNNDGETQILVADPTIEPDAEGVPGMPTIDS